MVLALLASISTRSVAAAGLIVCLVLAAVVLLWKPRPRSERVGRPKSLREVESKRQRRPGKRRAEGEPTESDVRDDGEPQEDGAAPGGQPGTEAEPGAGHDTGGAATGEHGEVGVLEAAGGGEPEPEVEEASDVLAGGVAADPDGHDPGEPGDDASAHGSEAGGELQPGGPAAGSSDGGGAGGPTGPVDPWEPLDEAIAERLVPLEPATVERHRGAGLPQATLFDATAGQRAAEEAARLRAQALQLGAAEDLRPLFGAPGEDLRFPGELLAEAIMANATGAAQTGGTTGDAAAGGPDGTDGEVASLEPVGGHQASDEEGLADGEPLLDADGSDAEPSGGPADEDEPGDPDDGVGLEAAPEDPAVDETADVDEPADTPWDGPGVGVACGAEAVDAVDGDIPAAPTVAEPGADGTELGAPVRDAGGEAPAVVDETAGAAWGGTVGDMTSGAAEPEQAGLPWEDDTWPATATGPVDEPGGGLAAPGIDDEVATPVASPDPRHGDDTVAGPGSPSPVVGHGEVPDNAWWGHGGDQEPWADTPRVGDAGSGGDGEPGGEPTGGHVDDPGLDDGEPEVIGGIDGDVLDAPSFDPAAGPTEPPTPDIDAVPGTPLTQTSGGEPGTDDGRAGDTDGGDEGHGTVDTDSTPEEARDDGAQNEDPGGEGVQPTASRPSRTRLDTGASRREARAAKARDKMMRRAAREAEKEARRTQRRLDKAAAREAKQAEKARKAARKLSGTRLVRGASRRSGNVAVEDATAAAPGKATEAPAFVLEKVDHEEFGLPEPIPPRRATR